MNKIVFYFKILSFGAAIKIILLKGINLFLFNRSSIYFSQFGEDNVIDEYLWDQKDGFYIDIGCYKPIQYSNTIFLYLRGWKGLAIDANESIINEFRRTRKKDLTINAVLSDKEETKTFYRFETDSMSTLHKGLAEGNKVKEAIQVKTQMIHSILDKNLEEGQKVDLLSIDVEGEDFNVLKTYDFDKYRPSVIAIENLNFDFQSINGDRIYLFLEERGYKLVSHVKFTNIFVAKEKL